MPTQRGLTSMQLTIPIPECQQTVRLPAGVMNWSEDEFFDFCHGQEGRAPSCIELHPILSIEFR